MADGNVIKFECDWPEAFNRNPARTTTLGYVVKWSGCGGLNLKQDIEVWNPYPDSRVQKGSSIKCVGVMESFEYGGSELDPIRIVAYISASTSASIRSKLSQGLRNTNLKLDYFICSFDKDVNSWYDGAYVKSPSAGASATLNTTRGEMQLFTQSTATPISENINIGVYRMEFEVVPQEGKKSNLQVSLGKTVNLVKQWGE
ncbi:MAG: hypothetical protein VYA34_08565 [Myxococcota bacterium]|nr:hypothetical protein [Myxococcota bacterium]